MKCLLVIALALCLPAATAHGEEESSSAGSAPPALESPSATQPVVQMPPPGSGTGAAALQWTTPPEWQSEPPKTAMRRAQYRVPGDAGDAECIVFYLGPGEGGDAMANAQRWASQFTLADGRPGHAEMKVDRRKVGDIDVVLVEVGGTYQGGFRMQAQQPAPKPGQLLLGAIAEGPDANWFFKLIGPEATVESHRAAFEDLVESLKRGG